VTRQTRHNAGKPMKTLFRLLEGSLVMTGLIISSGLLFAQQPDAKPRKFAVLVGVKDYDHSKLASLAYSEADAAETATLLKANGYTVVLLTDTEGNRDASLKPTRANIIKQLDLVLDKCKKHDTVLVGLAGHGLQFEADKASYFCPVDAHPSKPETLVSLKTLYEKLDDSGAGVKLLLVDACRDDPLGGRGRGIDGDTAPKPPKGVAALFSCSGGERAFEHDKLKHGVFFYHVIEGLKGKAKTEDNEVTWDSLRAYVKRQVSREVPVLMGGGAKQHPNEVGNLSGEPPVLVRLAGASALSNAWKPGEEIEVEIGKDVKMKFCWIPPGEAKLGSPKSERDEVLKHLNVPSQIERLELEAEEYRGTFKTSGFWLGKFEVTQEQWQSVMSSNPSYFVPAQRRIQETGIQSTRRFPVESVSWNDCQDFLKKITERANVLATMGRGRFVLPHENEWEYAARGGKGNLLAFYFGNQLNGSKANCAGSGPYGMSEKTAELGRTVEVGSYATIVPHPRGLCDIYGNVSEWCENEYKENARVVRGGSCFLPAWFCRSADRVYSTPANRSFFRGFRVCFRLD